MNRWRELGRLLTLGIEMVSATALGILIGYWLDKKLSTKPFLTIIFLLLGIAAGFVNLFKAVGSISIDEKRNRNSEKRDESHK